MTAAAGTRPSNFWLLLGAAGLIAVSISLQVVRDRAWQPYGPATPVLWIPSAAVLQRASLGFTNLVADVYWIRAVVYYGSRRAETRADKNYELLYPFLDVVTRLDSRFQIAYRFGALFLAEPLPDGPGRPDLAIRLLERGLEQNPGAWEYAQDIGFVHYWWVQDYKSAAAWFERSAQIPGAPSWLRLVAATTLAEGGDRASSRVLWRNIYENADTEWMKDSATLRLQQLDAMDALDQLNAIASRYAARFGGPAARWEDLIRGERLRGIPLDPSGTPYEIEPVTGRIVLAVKSPLNPLPIGRGTRLR
jgi:hypothetical protein